MFDSIVLNEASLPFESVEDCENNIIYFFDLLHYVKNKKIQFSRADDFEGSWNKLNYANGFNFDKWLNAIEDRDRQTQIKRIIHDLKCPLMSLAPNKRGVDVTQVLFYHESNRDTEARGLALAHLNDLHSLSAPSKEWWLQNSISLIKGWYRDTDFIEEIVYVPNISTSQQLTDFFDQFNKLRQENKSFLANLKVQDNPDFPNLLFTEKFLKSVKSASLLPIDFKRLITVLTSLNLAIINSENLQDLAQNSSLTITNESDTTMENDALSKQREFKHPTLGKQIFEPHIKNFVNGKRMHILPDYKKKEVCIGYFGNHLKT